MNPIECLTSAQGRWCGPNTLQDPNTGKPEESPSTLTVTPMIGGRFVRLDYTWVHAGTPHEGSMIVGFEPKSGEVSVHWMDSWHMGRKAMNCTGTFAEGTISVRGSYAAPPGPDWGWRIDITPGDVLRIRHTNLYPDGKEELAVEGVYARGAFFKSSGPIGETDVNAIPVREIGPAVGFYTSCLGFSQESKDAKTARLKRDDVEIGLAVNGLDPEQASCWFSVGDVDDLWREYEAKGISPGIIDKQEYGGKAMRVFFAKDPYGVCFCFTQPLGA